MIILFFIIGVVLAVLLTKSNKTEMKCYPHKWVYKQQDGNEYMVCDQCKRLPGTDMEEEG